MKKFTSLFFLTFVTVFSTVGMEKTISVKSQAQFDEIIERINNGESLHIKLGKGTFRLSKPLSAKGTLTVKGRNSTIESYTDTYNFQDAVSETSTHYICPLKSPLNEFSLAIDQSGVIVPISESVDESRLVNTTSIIEGHFEKGKAGLEIRIPIPANLVHLKNMDFNKAFGYFDCGWADIKFKLNSSDCVYFYCKTLNSTNVPDFNYEKYTYKDDIRFVIYNAELKSNSVYYDSENIYIPKNVEYLKVKDYNGFNNEPPTITVNGSLEMSGISFVGIESMEINSPSSSTCNINHCTFKHTLGSVIKISKDNDENLIPVNISNCVFEECSILKGNMVYLTGTRKGETSIHINGCRFIRYPNSMVKYKNTSSMVYVNTNSKIANCHFSNTSRCHLFFSSGNSIVEGSVIYNTPEFNSAKQRNLSNDWGLIYVDHLYKDADKAKSNKSNIVVIEGCYLHGAYAHANDARGVMIDDGRGDVICRNNIVTDCQCFSLDSRDAKSFISTSSIRNRFENNILGSRYRLAGGQDLSTTDYPVSSGNIVFGKFKNIFNDKTHIIEGDVEIGIEFTSNNEKIILTSNSFDKLKNLPYLNKVKNFIKIID